jgi:hypothetical protein
MQSIHLRLILSNSILFTHKRKGNGGGSLFQTDESMTLRHSFNLLTGGRALWEWN